MYLINPSFPSNDSLVHWWLGLPNVAGGRYFYDIVGMSNGTLTNTPTWEGSNINKISALALTKANSNYVVVPDNLTNLRGSNLGFSFAGWIKTFATPSSGDHYVLIANKGDINNTDDAFISISVSGSDSSRIGVYQFIDSSNPNNSLGYSYSNYVHSNSSIVARTWTHVAISFRERTIALYLNGKLDVSHTVTYDVSLFNIAKVNQGLHFGRYNSSFPYYFNGNINDYRFYNKGLSAGQIYNIYEDSVQGYKRSLIDTSSNKYSSYSNTIGSILNSNFFSLFSGGGF